MVLTAPMTTAEQPAVDAPDTPNQADMAALEANARAPSDPGLLEALVFVAAHHGRPVSASALLSGLPLETGFLDRDTLPRAAARGGLACEVVQQPLTAVSAAVVPVIVFLKNSGCLVVTALDKEGQWVDVVDPRTRNGTRVSLPTLAAACDGTTVLTAPLNASPVQSELIAGREPAPPHWFWSVIFKFWPNYAQVAFAALVLNMLGLALPLFSMNVYDRVVPNAAVATLWALAIGVLIALIFDMLLRTVRSEIVDVAGKKADLLLASRVFEHVMSIRLERRPGLAGAFANQVREFETVRDFFTSATLIALTDVVFIVIFAAVMFALVGSLAWVSVLAVPLVVAITLLIQIPLGRAIAKAQREGALRHAILIEAVTGLETIKSVGGEGRMQRAWERAVAATARSSHDSRFWATVATHATAFVQQAVTIVTLIWGVYLIQDGSITTGALVASTILGGRMLAPLAGISATLSRLQQTIVALRSIEGVMAIESERPLGKPFVARPITDGAVRFENVTLTYPGAALPAIKDVSFSVAPGERVGIIGRMGSGKSTVGRLVAGLYAPEKGTVFLDGVDARQMDPADIRGGVGLVGQDPELFVGTLRDNIAFGRPDATDAEIVDAAKLTGVDEFASRHPRGYDMVVGERGRTLSGGQRQTVAIARCIIRKPRILFLDEPSSAMDTASETQLIDKLLEIGGSGITVMISTHRHSLLQVVDRLLVFDRGALVMDGPRDAVLKELARRGRRESPAPEAGKP